MVDQAPIALFQCKKSFIIYGNQALADLTQIPLSDFLDGSWIERVYEKDLSLLPSIFGDITPAGEKLLNQETIRLRTSHEGVKVFMVTSSKKLGEEFVSIGSFRDVTDQLQFQSNQQSLCERMQLSLSQFSVGVWEWDIKEDFLIWDAAMYALYGLEKTIFPRNFKTWLDAVVQQDRQRVQREIQTASNKKDLSLLFSFKIKRPSDSGIRDIRCKLVIEYGADGGGGTQPTRMFGLNWDVTKEEELNKQIDAASQALEQQKSELVAILDAIPSEISRWDSSFLNLHANKAFKLRFLVGESRDLTGIHIRNIIGEELYSKLAPYMQKVIQGHLQKFEMERLHAAGTVVGIVYECIQMIPDIYNGATVGSFMISIDVTGYKLLENELIASQKSEVAANLAKSAFLASMSHELRTPLNGIIGMTDLLLGTQLSPEQRDYAETIGHSGKLLLSIISDVLDFSKIEAGKMELDLSDFDFIGMIKEITKPFQYTTEKKGIDFSLVSEINLPELLVNGDRGRISQVVCNLIGNAIKFTDSGGAIIVTIKLSSPATMSLVDVDSSNQAVDIFIGVKDSGIGIIQEHQKSIFDSFKQVPHSGKRQSITGTGLGLSISKKLVYMMGGDLSFTSEEGVGSNFYFQIPLKRIVLKAPTLSSVILETPQSIITAAAVAAEAAEAAAAATNTPVILPATTPAVVEAPLQFIGRVLVAEDNAINRKVIEKLIEKRGLAFTTVVDGVEAVKEYLKDPNAFQLVLMDCQMPNMDGFEATKAIREASSTRQSRIPIIAITANAIQGDEEKCLQAGMDAYITKPIRPHLLDNALSKFLMKQS